MDYLSKSHRAGEQVSGVTVFFAIIVVIVWIGNDSWAMLF